MKLYLRLMGFLKPYFHFILLTGLLSLLIVTAESLSLWFAGALIRTLFIPEPGALAKPLFSLAHINDWLKFQTAALVSKGNMFDSLKAVCFLVFGMFLLKNVMSYIKSLVLAKVNINVMRDLRNAVFGRAVILPVSYYDRNRSGNIISLILNDISAVNSAMMGTFDKLLIDPLRVVFFVTTLFILSPKMTLTVLVTYPVFGVVIGYIGQTVRRRSRKMYDQFEGLTSRLHETMNCIRAVKMFNTAGAEVLRFKDENEKLSRINFRTNVSVAISSPLTETLGVLVTVILLWVGGREVLAGKGFGAEDFIRFLTFLFMMFQPLKSLGQVNNTIQYGLAAGGRVFGLVDTKPEPLKAFVKEELPHFDREIRFRNVRFAYPECADEVLHDISFTIPKGQVVALVGSSGSGKSTILDLLPRFYELTSGAILIDGKDIGSFDLAGLRQLFGIVAQETILFNDTIYNNIAYGMQDASEEKVIEAARVANAWEFIEKTTLGLHTVIGERGVMLSGGQRQRLSIARAILKNPAVLILDEATSALDTESERLVQAAIQRLMENRTSLVVAHRLSTIAHADMIIVLEDGRITEQGTHGELIKRSGRYKYFYDIQFSSALHPSEAS
jgi:ATP-binding cassette, subfamily B, bacterial MsbA